MEELQGPDLADSRTTGDNLDAILETFIEDRGGQDRYFAGLAKEAESLREQLVISEAGELTLQPPVRVRDGFGPGLEMEYNFTEDGLVIDVHKPVEGESVWSATITHVELVKLLDKDGDILTA